MRPLAIITALLILTGCSDAPEEQAVAPTESMLWVTSASVDADFAEFENARARANSLCADDRLKPEVFQRHIALVSISPDDSIKRFISGFSVSKEVFNSEGQLVAKQLDSLISSEGVDLVNPVDDGLVPSSVESLVLTHSKKDGSFDSALDCAKSGQSVLVGSPSANTSSNLLSSGFTRCHNPVRLYCLSYND